jgi:hypothetical protein
MKNIVNIVAFQAVWFASVIGAASGVPWLGAVLLVPFAIWQLSVSDDPAYDSLYPLAGVLGYVAPWPVSGLAPAWLVLMWINLGLTLNHSLAWLRGRHLLASVFGGIGGGLSYYAGYRLGAMELYWPAPLAIGLIGLVWAAALPVMYAILDRMARLSSGSVPTPR